MSYKNILYLDATYLTVYILQKPKINIYNIYIGKDFLMHFIIVFFISMFPLIELRGAIPYAVAQGLPLVPSYIIAIIGNMLPVPVIFLFARKSDSYCRTLKFCSYFCFNRICGYLMVRTLAAGRK